MDQLTSDAALLESYAERGQAMLEARHAYPVWATAAYALAVWVGLLASIFYLMRKKLWVEILQLKKKLTSVFYLE